MNLTLFEKKHFVYRAELDRMRGQPSLEAMWINESVPASWRLWLVASLPTLAERCRWASAELARQFAIVALDVARVTNPAADALRACAPVTDERTACAMVMFARRAACYDVSAIFDDSAAACYDAADAADACWASDSADFAISACSKATHRDSKGDLCLGGLVRDAIPWAWVREAAAVDAPELLEEEAR